MLSYPPDSLLEARDVRGLWPFLAVFDGELHTLILVEVTKTLTHDGCVVDEHIVATIVGCDKAITLCAAEPLDCTGLSLHREFLLPQRFLINYGCPDRPLRRPERYGGEYLHKKSPAVGAAGDL
jgi:hypothetical protein